VPKNSLSSLTERKSSQGKWKKSILRRKNNGSQGKIITGLSGKRHSVLIEKAKLLVSQEPTSRNP